MGRALKLRLHVGPHRTATTSIQYAAHRNRALLARHGVLFLNEPAQSTRMPAALNSLRDDLALEEFQRLLDARVAELGGLHPAPSLLFSSETLFAAPQERAAEYEACFTRFLAALGKRGHEVDLVFVERNLEDMLTSNALLQASIGNLKFVTPEPQPYLHYLHGYAWKKAFYFRTCPVAHLDFAVLTRTADVFANFMELAYGLELEGLQPIDPAIDARNTQSDAQIATGLVMAPMINWLEQFGSLPRFDLFNGSVPLVPPVTGPAWDAIVGNVPLLRDCVRANSRRAIEMFVQGQAPDLLGVPG